MSAGKRASFALSEANHVYAAEGDANPDAFYDSNTDALDDTDPDSNAESNYDSNGDSNYESNAESNYDSNPDSNSKYGSSGLSEARTYKNKVLRRRNISSKLSLEDISYIFGAGKETCICQMKQKNKWLAFIPVIADITVPIYARRSKEYLESDHHSSSKRIRIAADSSIKQKRIRSRFFHVSVLGYHARLRIPTEYLSAHASFEEALQAYELVENFELSFYKKGLLPVNHSNSSK
jgi:hypothetical protein